MACSSLYYSDGTTEAPETPAAEVPALLAAGKITAETLVFSEDAAFPFEGWTAWSSCASSFGVEAAAP